MLKSISKNEVALYGIVGWLLLLFYWRDILDQDFSKILFILPIIVYSIIVSSQYIAYLMALLLPLSFGLSTGYIFPIVLIIYFYKIKKFPTNAVLFTVLIIVIELIHYPFYTFTINTEMSTYLNYFSAWFIVAYFVSNIDERVDAKRFLLFFCLAVVILSFFITWHSVIAFDTIGYELEGTRIGDTGIIGAEEDGKIYLRANANTLGYFSITAISILLLLLYRKSVHFSIAILLLAILIITGGMTMSRTWLVLLAFVFFAFLSVNSRGGFKSILLGGIILGLLTILILFTRDYLDIFLERFSGDKTLSGRTEIISFYNDALFNNIDILFSGTGAIHYVKVLNYDHAIHNGTQQVLVCYGLTGFFLLTIPLLMRILKLKKRLNVKGKVLYYTPLIVVLFFLQTIQSINPHQLMFPLIPAIWALSLNNNVGTINKKKR